MNVGDREVSWLNGADFFFFLCARAFVYLYCLFCEVCSLGASCQEKPVLYDLSGFRD